MHEIAELNLLLRMPAELPVGLRVATETFREGWSLVQTLSAATLKRKIQTRGWHLIEITDGSVGSGVGETSQEAVAGALKLALRRIGEYFNAVQVGHIELTTYPWFFLARVTVSPYRIQKTAIFPLPDKAQTEASRKRRSPASAGVLFPQFGIDVPSFKRMLISGKSPKSVAIEFPPGELRAARSN